MPLKPLQAPNPVLMLRSRYIGFTGFVPTIPKNVMCHDYGAVKSILKTSLSTCCQNLKVPYLTGEQYQYIDFKCNTPNGMVGTSKFVQYTVVYG